MNLNQDLFQFLESKSNTISLLDSLFIVHQRIYEIGMLLWCVTTICSPCFPFCEFHLPPLPGLSLPLWISLEHRKRNSKHDRYTLNFQSEMCNRISDSLETSEGVGQP